MIKVEKNTKSKEINALLEISKAIASGLYLEDVLAADRHGHRQFDGLKDLFPLDSR